MSGAKLVLERRIAAPVKIVYELLTDPMELRHWLGPSDFVVTRFHVNGGHVRVGARFQFRMRKPGGGEYGASGEFRELVENQRVVFSWTWNEAPPGEPLDESETVVSISLQPDGAHTLLTLVHAQLPDDDSAEQHAAGWREALKKLDVRACARRKGQVMQTEVVLAAVAVGDIESSIAWYGKLLGRSFDERPMKEAAEWRLASHAGIQLVADKQRAGQSMVTIGVPDIERLVKELDARGVRLQATPPGEGPFRLAQLRDPDGNLLTFAQDQRG